MSVSFSYVQYYCVVPLLAYPVAELAVDFFCNESAATMYLKSDTNSFYVISLVFNPLDME